MIDLILAINPNPLNTRVAVYRNTDPIFWKTIKHNMDDLKEFQELSEQTDFRTQKILSELKENDICLDYIKIIMARGGLIKPVSSGIYQVNESMKNDLKIGVMGTHANNLGGLIADALLAFLPQAKAYIADPVVVDEMEPVARISGHPLFERKSIFHALNQKFVARKYAKSTHRAYEDLNLIVVHVESGISIGVHKNGRVIDVNQALDGEGPFSFERSGTLPVGDLMRMCYSGKHTQAEIMELISSKGGLQAYLGLNTLPDLENRVENGDEYAGFITQAMAYQIAKEIGAMSTVHAEDIDAIILSGEIFGWSRFSNYISSRVEKIAPVVIFPNENEMEALAMNGLMLLKGEAAPLQYS